MNRHNGFVEQSHIVINILHFLRPPGKTSQPTNEVLGWIAWPSRSASPVSVAAEPWAGLVCRSSQPARKVDTFCPSFIGLSVCRFVSSFACLIVSYFRLCSSLVPPLVPLFCPSVCPSVWTFLFATNCLSPSVFLFTSCALPMHFSCPSHGCSWLCPFPVVFPPFLFLDASLVQPWCIFVLFIFLPLLLPCFFFALPALFVLFPWLVPGSGIVSPCFVFVIFFCFLFFLFLVFLSVPVRLICSNYSSIVLPVPFPSTCHTQGATCCACAFV